MISEVVIVQVSPVFESFVSKWCIDELNELEIRTGAFEQRNNSLIMLLKCLESLQIGNVFITGADGHVRENIDYYNEVYA